MWDGTPPGHRKEPSATVGPFARRYLKIGMASCSPSAPAHPEHRRFTGMYHKLITTFHVIVVLTRGSRTPASVIAIGVFK